MNYGQAIYRIVSDSKLIGNVVRLAFVVAGLLVHFLDNCYIFNQSD